MIAILTKKKKILFVSSVRLLLPHSGVHRVAGAVPEGDLLSETEKHGIEFGQIQKDQLAILPEGRVQRVPKRSEHFEKRNRKY